MTDTIRIIIARIDLVEGKAPAEFVLFRAGWNELADGPRYWVDKESYDLITAYWAKRGIECVIDYEHQSLGMDRAPAAGWIKELVWDDNRGIIVRAQWTDQGADYIAKGEYRYFSPVFEIREKDLKLIGLYSVALTNVPRHNNLDALAAKLGEIKNQKKEEPMEFFKLLFAKLGLAEGATIDAVMGAIDTLAAKAKEVREVVAKEVIEALGLAAGSDTSTVVASIHAIKQAPKGMVSRAEYDTLVAKLNQRDADEAVAAAVKAGKVTSDQKEWADEYALRDPEGFKKFVAKAPVVIPLDKLPKGENPTATALDETTLAVAKLMGNSAEDLKKYAGVQQ